MNSLQRKSINWLNNNNNNNNNSEDERLSNNNGNKSSSVAAGEQEKTVPASAPWRRANPPPSVSLVAVAVNSPHNAALLNGNAPTEAADVAKTLQNSSNGASRPGLLFVDTSLCQDKTLERSVRLTPVTRSGSCAGKLS